MSTFAHASLTGADLHEPKGAASAASGTVYVANGSGSGSWTTLSALTGDVGKIEMFITPLVPAGYLACDGTAISRTTYANLFTAVTIQQTGTRTNSSITITGLSDTSNMQIGYYVGGTGIPNGTQIVTIPGGGTSLTLTASATSTGSNTLIISPWPLGNGTTTFTLPNMQDSGRHPRARYFGSPVGTYLTNQNLAHTHTGTTTANGSAVHAHTGTTGNVSADHTHSVGFTNSLLVASVASTPHASLGYVSNLASTNTTGANANHTHAFTTDSSGDHTHIFTTNTSGGLVEARPEGLVLLFCVRY